MDDCHANHHVNHITTDHQVVGKCNSLGTCDFPGENILGHETAIFRVKWLLGSPKYVSVSAGAGLDLRKLPTKSAQECSENLHFKLVRSALGR